MKNTLLGSVGHRVMQHAAADILVIEGGPFINQGEMVVAIDGSPHSFAGLKKAPGAGPGFRDEYQRSFRLRPSISSAGIPYPGRSSVLQARLSILFS